MTDNNIIIIKGMYIKEYLSYYLDLKYFYIEPYDWGYKIEATTKLNDFNININIEKCNYKIEELCDIALNKIKTEILKQYFNPHL